MTDFDRAAAEKALSEYDPSELDRMYIQMNAEELDKHLRAALAELDRIETAAHCDYDGRVIATCYICRGRIDRLAYGAPWRHMDTRPEHLAAPALVARTARGAIIRRVAPGMCSCGHPEHLDAQCAENVNGPTWRNEPVRCSCVVRVLHDSDIERRPGETSDDYKARLRAEWERGQR